MKKDNSIYFTARRIDRPEVIVGQAPDLEKLLSRYEGRTVGLVEAHNLNEETRCGILYHEGTLVVDHTRDDKGNPVNVYYVERNDGCRVPIDLSDGLFLDNLPTQPKRWSPHN